MPSEQDDDLADLVHQTAMYHEDRLGGGGFAAGRARGRVAARARGRSIGCGASSKARLGTRVEPLDFRGAVALRDRIAAAPELLDSLAPAIG